MCYSPERLSNRAEQQMIFGAIEGLDRSVRSSLATTPPTSPAVSTLSQSPEGRRSHVLAAWRSSTPTQSMELSSFRLAGKATLPNMFEVMSTDDSDGGDHSVMFESDATDSWELQFHKLGRQDEEDGTDSWELQVKNTFFHVNEEMTETLSARRFRMERSKSLPPVFAPRMVSQEEVSPTLSHSPFAEVEDAGDEGGELSAEAKNRQPSWSVGSEKHGTGSCKPCAWYYKSAQGCQNGEDCMHCHLCPLGEIRRRRKRTMPKKRYGGNGSAGAAPNSPAFSKLSTRMSG